MISLPQGVCAALPYRHRWTEIPLLANNSSEGTPAIRRPSQGELLCALGFGFLEIQPDTFQLLRLVEQKSDDLGSGLSSAPAACHAELQRTFNRMRFIFRCNLDRRRVGQIEPRPIKW